MLAIITCYFNPQKYKTRLENYWLFRNKLEQNGYSLHTIELSYDGNFDIEDAIHLKTENVIWSKENLLNILVDKLPKEYDVIAWLDCDIVFQQYQDIDFAYKLISSVKKYDVLQLFNKVLKLPPKDSEIKVANFGTSVVARYLGEDFDGVGELGFAWMAKREIFPLYDKCIVGGGDTIFFERLIKKDLSDTQKNNFSKWHRQDIQNYFLNCIYDSGEDNLKFGYLDTTIFHLNHGDEKNRNYSARNSILQFFDYNPKTDVKYDENGLLIWSENAEMDMRVYIRDFFINRQEDSNSIDFCSDKKCSVVLMSWKRPNNIITICEKLSKYNNINDIVVFNNNRDYSLSFNCKKTRIINSNFDFGLMSRISSANFTETETVVFIDDDIMPSENTITKIIYYVNKKDNMCSLHGRMLGPNGEYSYEDYFGYSPIVLTRCLGISKKDLCKITNEHRIWQEYNSDKWPKANDFPADDIFLSFAYNSIKNKKPFALNAEYEELGDFNAMYTRPGIKEKRQETIMSLRRFFNISQKAKFGTIKKYNEQKCKHNIVTICPSLDKACGVGNFAKNMDRYLFDFNNKEGEKLYLIQHEHGLFKDKDRFIEELKLYPKKVLFAHSLGVEFLEEYVDGFIQMCPDMIKTDKPLYTMRHPGFFKNKKNIDKNEFDSSGTGRKFTVGTCGFINPSRDFEYILERLIPVCETYGWNIYLPLSLHENHIKHEKYVDLENYLESLAKNNDCIILEKDFKTQEELFNKLSQIDIGWCWTNTPSKKYGSGTASDIYCGVNKLVVSNKEQHQSVFGLNHVIVTPDNLEKFTDELIFRITFPELSTGNCGRIDAHRRLLSWENQIHGFIEWSNSL